MSLWHIIKGQNGIYVHPEGSKNHFTDEILKEIEANNLIEAYYQKKEYVKEMNLGKEK